MGVSLGKWLNEVEVERMLEGQSTKIEINGAHTFLENCNEFLVHVGSRGEPTQQAGAKLKDQKWSVLHKPQLLGTVSTLCLFSTRTHSITVHITVNNPLSYF